MYVVGDLAAHAAEAFGADAQVFPDQAALIAALKSDLRAGVSLLVKGSHASRMDNVVTALLGQGQGDDRHAA